MSARYSHEFTPQAAERLLDGDGRDAPEPLARLLSAAAAPGRPHELAAEDTVVAAFEHRYAGAAAPGAARVPGAARRRRARAPLAGLLTAKVLALIAGVGATGAVALAAASGAFNGASAPVNPSAKASPVISAYSPSSAQASTRPAPTAAAATTAPASPGIQATRPQGQGSDALCRELTAQGPGALAGPRYASLVQEAGNTLAVPDYCALLLRLPALPQPGEITALPVAVLAPLLTRLPAGTLGQVLAELPASTRVQVLRELPAPVLSTILTELPTGSLNQVLGQLPAADVSAVLARLPGATVSKVLTELPSSVVSGVKPRLPAPLVSQLPLG